MRTFREALQLEPIMVIFYSFLPGWMISRRFGSIRNTAMLFIRQHAPVVQLVTSKPSDVRT